jgi:GPH family glycoside/pentoside/hexuronide:cation symporter
MHKGEGKVRFRDAIKFTLKNKAFWPLVLGNFVTKFGMCLTGIFFYYLLIYHMSGGDSGKGSAQWGIFCNVINISTFIAMAPFVWFVDRIGKKPAILMLMIASAAAYGSVWFTFQPHMPQWVVDIGGALHRNLFLPEVIVANWPSLITAAAIGIFCNALPLLINSMLADVCDIDELACGHQRQAFYGATFVTCDKIAMAVAMLFQGILLSASGFDAEKAKTAAVSAETIGYWMKALLLTQPTGFLIGFFILLAYPISHATAKEVRRQLDERQANRSSKP